MADIMNFFANNPLLTVAWVGLLIVIIVMTVKSWFSKVKEISRNEATLLLNRENGQIIDIRSREDYRKGHIINAINISPSDIKSGNVKELEKYKRQPVIVVCNMGTSARESAERLYKAGFEPVFVLKEGITGWRGENLPLVKSK